MDQEWTKTSSEPNSVQTPKSNSDVLIIYSDNLYKLKYGVGHVENDSEGPYWIIDGKTEGFRSVLLFYELKNPKDVIYDLDN